MSGPSWIEPEPEDEAMAQQVAHAAGCARAAVWSIGLSAVFYAFVALGVWVLS